MNIPLASPFPVLPGERISSPTALWLPVWDYRATVAHVPSYVVGVNAEPKALCRGEDLRTDGTGIGKPRCERCLAILVEHGLEAA